MIRTRTFPSGRRTVQDMREFVALLAALALLSAGLGSAVSREQSSGAPRGRRGPGAADSAAGPGGCPGRCRCEPDGPLVRVDCSDRGLREVPNNLSVFTSFL